MVIPVKKNKKEKLVWLSLITTMGFLVDFLNMIIFKSFLFLIISWLWYIPIIIIGLMNGWNFLDEEK